MTWSLPDQSSLISQPEKKDHSLLMTTIPRNPVDKLNVTAGELLQYQVKPRDQICGVVIGAKICQKSKVKIDTKVKITMPRCQVICAGTKRMEEPEI